MKLKELSDVSEEGAFGFKWGPMEVARLCSNDGSNKRKAWWTIGVRTDKEYLIVTVFLDGSIHVEHKIMGCE